jgi:hypothetical protein
MSGTIEAGRLFDDVEPLLVRPRVARRMLGNIGTERLWELINSGELESYLDGRARRITVASIKAHIASRLALKAARAAIKTRAPKLAKSRKGKHRLKAHAMNGREVTA